MTDVATPTLRERLSLLDVGAEAEAEHDLGDLLRRIRGRMHDQVGSRITRQMPDDERSSEVRRLLDEILSDEQAEVSPTTRRQLIRQVLSDTLGYGPLDDLMADEHVTEIMCNGPDTIYVERNGRIEETDLSFGDEAHLRAVINRIVRSAGRRIDESAPMVDARMPDGSRMNAILPPLSLNGPILTIRRFPNDHMTPATLVRMGTYSPELMSVLAACVKGRLNVVVSGGTSSGKTTGLNALSSFIGREERLITIEDSAELTLRQPHVITLESRPPNTEGEGQVTIRDLVRNALRMRPDRLIIGECRSGEALDMLQAMNTGHDGSLTTVHANSARDALRRLEMMVTMSGYDVPIWAIREQMASTIHLVLQMERLPSGRRIVRSLTEVQTLERDTILMQDLFVWDSTRQEVVPTGLRPSFLPVLERRGVTYPMDGARPVGVPPVVVGPSTAPGPGSMPAPTGSTVPTVPTGANNSNGANGSNGASPAAPVPGTAS